jgi:transcriptional regulator with XRE-family HTH domain
LWDYPGVPGDPPDVIIQTLVGDALRRAGSQAKLAAQVGVSQQTISNWNSGKLPKPEEAVRLAVALGHDPLTLLGHLWPAIAEADPVPAELRAVLARATPRQRRAVVTEAKRIVGPPKPLRLVESEHQAVPMAAAKKRGAAMAKRPSIRKTSRPSPRVEEDPET